MTLDEALADARTKFPTMPSDVFTLWLDDRIRSSGWPPEGIEWDGFLDGKPMCFWQSLKWRRETVTLTPHELTSSAFTLVMQLIEAAQGRSNLMSQYIPDTAQRFKSCMDYVCAHSTTPGIVVLLRTDEGTTIVEGNHRVSALLAYQSRLPPESQGLRIDAWVAQPPK